MPTLPILTGGHFQVRRIYCVGQNYRAHTIEMGGDPDRQAPFFFTKPGDAIVTDGGQVPYPPRTQQLDHEVELVVAIGADATDVAPQNAMAAVFGYTVGLDMTRRDLQAVAKKAGRPWDMAKGFDHSAPCGALTKMQAMLPGKSAIELRVDGAMRQSSRLSEMIWSVPEIVAELSAFVTLREGDLIYTGTPENVGPVQRGQVLVAHIDGLADLTVTIA